MEFNRTVNQLNELDAAAKSLLESFPEHRKFIFEAPMGAGKTTFIKSILAQLNVADEVSSPTYSIINEYFSVSFGNIYHFDFYRINDELEAYDIGAEELIESDDYCFIEWPDRIPNLMPEKYVCVSIEVINEVRHIKAHT